MKRVYGQGIPSTGEQLRASTTAANVTAGSLTRHLREIERLPGWQRNRQLRDWHQRFSEARRLLTNQPPAAAPSLAAIEPADDDAATWLEVLGAR
jgi:hypothetical protein